MNTNQQIREQLKNPNLTDAQRRKLLNQYDTAAGIQQRNPNAQIVQRGKIQKPTNTFKQLFSKSVGASVRSDLLNNDADKIDLISRRFGAKGPTAFAQKLRQYANREMAHAYGHDARSWYNIANDNSMPLAMREDANNALKNRITQRQGLSQPGYIRSDWTGKDAFSRLGGAAVQGYMNDTTNALDIVDGVRAAWHNKFTKDPKKRARALAGVIADNAAVNAHRQKYNTNYQQYNGLGVVGQKLIETFSAPLEVAAMGAADTAGAKAGGAVASKFLKPAAEGASKLSNFGVGASKVLGFGAPQLPISIGMTASGKLKETPAYQQHMQFLNDSARYRQAYANPSARAELEAIIKSPNSIAEDKQGAANILASLNTTDKMKAKGLFVLDEPIAPMFRRQQPPPAVEEGAATDTPTTTAATTNNTNANGAAVAGGTSATGTPTANNDAGAASARNPWHSKYNWNMGDWFGNVNWQDVNSWLPGLLMALLGGGLVGGLSRNSWAALGSMPLFWGLTRGAQKNWGNIQQDLNIGNKGNNNVSK